MKISFFFLLIETMLTINQIFEFQVFFILQIAGYSGCIRSEKWRPRAFKKKVRRLNTKIFTRFCDGRVQL